MKNECTSWRMRSWVIWAFKNRSIKRFEFLSFKTFWIYKAREMTAETSCLKIGILASSFLQGFNYILKYQGIGLPTFPLPIKRFSFDWQEAKTLVVLGRIIPSSASSISFKNKLGGMASFTHRYPSHVFGYTVQTVYQEWLTWHLWNEILLLESHFDFAFMW